MDALTRMLLSTIYKVSDRISALHMKETCGSYFQPEPLLSTTGIASRQDFASPHSSSAGLRRLAFPWNLRTMDLMHLSVLNDPDLLLGLWRGTIKSIIRPMIPPPGTGLFSATKRSGELTVTLSRRRLHLFPRTFGRAPRNPAEKINSWVQSLGVSVVYIWTWACIYCDMFFRDPYWENYCKLVAGIQVLRASCHYATRPSIRQYSPQGFCPGIRGRFTTNVKHLGFTLF